VQLGAGRRCASAATAAIGGWDAHETVGPPANAVVSLSMLTKTAPTPRRARRAKARNLRTKEVLKQMGRGDTGGRRRWIAHGLHRPPGLPHPSQLPENQCAGRERRHSAGAIIGRMIKWGFSARNRQDVGVAESER